jgi:3-oxoacyl-[acyl-carrier-protein] synthase II
LEGRRVVVSGIGAVSPYGIGTDIYWKNLLAGNSAARLIDSYDASNLPTRFTAHLNSCNSDLDEYVHPPKAAKTLSRSGKMALIAAEEAMLDSGLDYSSMNPYRFGTSIGAGGVGLWDLDHANSLLGVLQKSVDSTGSINLENADAWFNVLRYIHPLTPLKALSNIPTAHLAINYNARGNCQTITTACTSSAQSIGEAYRQIKFNVADVMIAGGSDSMVHPYGIVAFSMLGVMSKNNDEWQTASRPFDRTRDGFMIGEGAAIVILEEMNHCIERGAVPLCEIIGYSSTNDAFRLTDEPPEAWGSIAAMESALDDAGLHPEKIDYINAHGTGTRMNDKAETLAIKSVFGKRAYSLPISSTKSMIGHLVAGAGAMEFVACVLSLRDQKIHPTINYKEPDNECDLDYVIDGVRSVTLKYILSNTFGFGGQNACLIIARP